MPKNQPTAAKKARARQRAEGGKYTELVRANPVPPARTAAATAVLTPGRGWQINVEGQPEPIRSTSWLVGRALGDRATVMARLSHMLAVEGWDLGVLSAWPAADPVPHEFPLHLERNDRGRRLDEAEAVLAAAGLSYHQAHEPYTAAVAEAIERLGVNVTDWFADANDPRDACITVIIREETDEDDEEKLLIVWTETRGWQCAWGLPDGSNTHPDDLPGPALGNTALPKDIAEAVALYLGAAPILPLGDAVSWQPAAGYDADAHSVDDPWDVNVALERALASYATHPAWHAHQALIADFKRKQAEAKAANR